MLIFCIVFFLVYETISFNSRSKLKFARGTPSDSIAFVNAFKVTCYEKSTASCFFEGFTYLPGGCCSINPSLLSPRHGTQPKRKGS